MRLLALSAMALCISGAVLTGAGCETTTPVGGSGSGAGGMGSGGNGSGGTGGIPSIGDVDKVDLLFMVDNSRSMADKQEVIAAVLSDLVQSLVNPACIDANGVPVANQPANGQDSCPAGSQRPYQAVNDLHVGVISSSIGGHGADACPTTETASCNGSPNTSNNDAAHLLDRQDACTQASVPTYQNGGFLAWDPGGKYSPAGDSDPVVLAQKFREIVLGAGQIGCGYESQLESWYRFLADPEPYQSISVVNAEAVPQGIDQTVLQQRSAFLRPDSLLAIVMLTDENDCSIQEEGQFYFAAQTKNANGTPFHMPAARPECAANPNDACCLSCGQDQMSCATQASCSDANGNLKTLSDVEDSINLRCFEQKRRFGIDFLYPIARYANALTQPMIKNRAGTMVPNPIFSDLDPNDAYTTIRDPGLVVLAGLVGVPWQSIARDPQDLSKGYKNADEMAAGGVWNAILGDPSNYLKPTDAHMVESIDPRAPLPPPGSAANADPIHGHEYTIAMRDDLQYACTFDLPSPRDCSDMNVKSCDCQNPNNDNPLCSVDPMTGQRTLQTKAKAYPSLRQLDLLKNVSGVVASVCPAQISNPAQGDFGYRPAVKSLIERIQGRLVK